MESGWFKETVMMCAMDGDVKPQMGECSLACSEHMDVKAVRITACMINPKTCVYWKEFVERWIRYRYGWCGHTEFFVTAGDSIFNVESLPIIYFKASRLTSAHHFPPPNLGIAQQGLSQPEVSFRYSIHIWSRYSFILVNAYLFEEEEEETDSGDQDHHQTFDNSNGSRIYIDGDGFFER